MGRGRKRLRRRNGDAAPPVVETKPVPELMLIAPGEVDVVWPLVISLIESEIVKSDWTEDSLFAACRQGSALLWMVCDQNDEAIAAMVTARDAYNRCVVCICSGHNLFDFVDARSQLYVWAKANGMSEVRFYGRSALQKLMPECKRIGIILSKEL